MVFHILIYALPPGQVMGSPEGMQPDWSEKPARIDWSGELAGVALSEAGSSSDGR
jgi:hypothetical protein